MILGVLLLAIAAPLYFMEQAFLARSITATGAVIDVQVDDIENLPSYWPIIEFTTQDGRTVRYDIDVCKSPH